MSDFTVDDWMELHGNIHEMETEWEVPIILLKKVSEAADFIKEALGIKTEPILTQSPMTSVWYLVNIYTEKDGLITSYNKRPATEEEIKGVGKEEEYKGKRFDTTKGGGVYASNPPKDFGLALCCKCKCIFETKDWKNTKAVCEVCIDE